MTFTDFASAIGAVAGLLSIVAWIYTWGFKLGKMQTQLDLLWKIDIEDSLRDQRRRGLMSQESPWVPSDNWWTSERNRVDFGLLKKTIGHLSQKQPRSDAESALGIIECLGWDTIVKRCDELGTTVQLYVAEGVAFWNAWVTKKMPAEWMEELEKH